MKLPARYAPVLFGALLSTIMVSVVSGILVSRQGLQAGFAQAWLHAFLNTWPVAFPTVLVVAPLVRRIVASVTAPAVR